MEDENDPILLTASYDSTIKFWATTQPSWECKKTVDIPKDVRLRFMHTFLEQQVVINKMKISNDKLSLACGTSSGVKIYDLAYQADVANVRLFSFLISKKSNFIYPSNVTSLGFKKNGNWLYAGSEDGTIRFHDLRVSGSQIIHKNDCEINAVALSPAEGELIAGD